jgi:hypothetical protein
MEENTRQWSLSFETSREAQDFLATYSDLFLEKKNRVERKNFETPGTFIMVENFHLLRSAISILSQDELVASRSDILVASKYLLKVSRGLERYAEPDEAKRPSEVETIWRTELREQLQLSQEAVKNALKKNLKLTKSVVLQLA